MTNLDAVRAIEARHVLTTYKRQPVVFVRGDGARLYDADGKEYIDLCCSHGATLLGHGDSRVRQAVEGVLARGAACSYENELHADLAQLLCETIPCMERVRFTGSGSEATMHCIRLARAYTGRDKVLKFEGAYHGGHDTVLVSVKRVAPAHVSVDASVDPVDVLPVTVNVYAVFA